MTPTPMVTAREDMVLTALRELTAEFQPTNVGAVAVAMASDDTPYRDVMRSQSLIYHTLRQLERDGRVTRNTSRRPHLWAATTTEEFDMAGFEFDVADGA